MKQKMQFLFRKEKSKFDKYFRGVSADAVDLVSKLLVFSPEKRLTAEEAILHPYVARFHCAEDEPVVRPLSMFDF